MRHRSHEETKSTKIQDNKVDAQRKIEKQERETKKIYICGDRISYYARLVE